MTGMVMESPGIFCVHPYGFFAQYVLASFKGTQRPFDMQVVRQRNVHRVHIRIAQQRFVGTVSPANAEICCHGSCHLLASRGQSKCHAAITGLNRRDDMLPCNTRC